MFSRTGRTDSQSPNGLSLPPSAAEDLVDGTSLSSAVETFEDGRRREELAPGTLARHPKKVVAQLFRCLMGGRLWCLLG